MADSKNEHWIYINRGKMWVGKNAITAPRFVQHVLLIVACQIRCPPIRTREAPCSNSLCLHEL